jgi:Uma2 family endonuclease
MASIHTVISRVPEIEPEPPWEGYLVLTDHTNRMAEYVDGKIEVLPMPTTEHQEIVIYLLFVLRAFITPDKLGRALTAPLRVKIGEDRFREPDLVFVLQRNSHRIASRYWDGADLVMEVVSEDGRDRDLIEKRRDYAEAGIAEYWIVDPRSLTITVLKLENGNYVTHSQAVSAGQVQSAILPGFLVEAVAVFDAARKAS